MYRSHFANRKNWAAVALVALGLTSACPDKDPGSKVSPAITENTAEPQWVVRQEQPARVAMVFVHGLFGDTVGTWTSEKGTRFFDLVADNPAIKGKVDMLAFGFPSRMFKSGSFDIGAAANKLHASLEYHNVLGYSKIVFVAHSMGGLVTMRELLTHREILPKVPLLVFLATPQEGADIARIARYVANNPALEQLKPADHNALLRDLSDAWNTLPDAQRPAVRCAYENKDTFGVRIVPWSSATRFCKGTPEAVDADHIGIVKTDRPQQEAVVAVTNALKTYVLNQSLDPKLETPDFQAQGDHDVFVLSDVSGKQAARLVNSGGSALIITLAEISDSSLYLWPYEPTELAANSTNYIFAALGFAATKSEYRFSIRTDIAPDRRVVVRVPSLPGIRAQQAALVNAIAQDLAAQLNDPSESNPLNRSNPEDPEVPQAVVRSVQQSVAHSNSELPVAVTWVITADVLNALNWSDLAVHALRNAERSSVAVTRLPGVLNLTAITAARSGNRKIFASALTPILSDRDANRAASRNPLTDVPDTANASHLAEQLRRVPALNVYGLSLLGDVKRAQGNLEEAQRAYQDAAVIRPSPSISRRLHDVGGWRTNRLDETGIHGGSETPAASTGSVSRPAALVKPNVFVRDPNDVRPGTTTGLRDKSSVLVQPAE